MTDEQFAAKTYIETAIRNLQNALVSLRAGDNMQATASIENASQGCEKAFAEIAGE